MDMNSLKVYISRYQATKTFCSISDEHRPHISHPKSDINYFIEQPSIDQFEFKVHTGIKLTLYEVRCRVALCSFQTAQIHKHACQNMADF